MKSSLHMRKMIGYTLFATTLLTSLVVNAWEDGGVRTVYVVGSHTRGLAAPVGFVIFVGSPTLPGCPTPAVYFDISTPLGKSMMNVLLMAKATGSPVQPGYALPATSVVPGVCGLEYVALF